MSDKGNLTCRSGVASMISPLGPRPIGDLFLEDQTGSVRFAPQEDMTARESAWLSVLLATYAAGGNGDWRSYLLDHGLQRHFQETKDG